MDSLLFLSAGGAAHATCPASSQLNDACLPCSLFSALPSCGVSLARFCHCLHACV